jgi:chromosome transmission fidelity protein 18
VPTRYAVRQVLDQELRRTIAHRDSIARQARFQVGGPLQTPLPMPLHDDKENREVHDDKSDVLIKRDFFGRVIEAKPLAELDMNSERRVSKESSKVWVTFHEGLNNAVTKPMSLKEFLKAL